MIMKDRIARSRIWLLAAGAASISIASWSFAHAAYGAGAAGDLATGARLMLRDGWQVQTSTGQPDGAVISKSGFGAIGWYPTSIPATVSGVLANAKVYPDPFFGANLREWPGMGRGGRGAAGAGAPNASAATGAALAPPSNPFSVGWWFRSEFDLPAAMAGRTITLGFEGINYRADIRSEE